MSVSTIGGQFQQFLIDSSTASSSTEDAAKKELGKEDFLTLLITQLKNQDPLNPMESVEFTAQLAQFSSLEQLFSVNDALGNIQNSVAAQEDGNLLDYIGKLVKTDDNRLGLTDGNADKGVYILEDRAEVTAYIYDEDDKLVRYIEEEWQEAGEHTFQWDGRDQDGRLLENGTFSFEIQAIDEGNYDVSHQIYSQGEVNGITYEDTVPYLVVGDRWVTPENIISVSKYDQ